MNNRTSRLNRGEAVKRRREQTIHYGRQLWQSVQKQKSLCLTGVLLTALTVLLFCLASQLPAPATDAAYNGAATIDYSTLVQQVNANNVLAVAFQGDDVNGLLATPLHSNPTTVQPSVHSDVAKSADYAAWISSLGISTFSHSNGPDPSTLNPNRIVSVHVPVGSTSLLMQSLENKHVLIQVIAASHAAALLTLLGRFVPLLLLVVIVLVFIFGRNRQQGMARFMDQRVSQLGKSRVRCFERTKEVSASQKGNAFRTPTKAIATSKSTSVRVSPVPSVTFADVAGIDEVRAELSEIVQFLRSPQLFNRLGARIPRGALLVGPPGTGKTLLARAVAGEAQVPFFSMSASEFVEMFVGVGASRVRDLFNQARQVSPCVIFIDELDAVGRKRSVRANGNDERDQTLNQLLVELDGFDERQAVVVLAATNRADILDKALLRPGRFDRCITVSLPDRVGRAAILNVHTHNTPLSEDVSLERLARMTTGMTGADLANLVNEAALLAARQELEAVNHECFEDALARVQLGALRPLVMGEDERRIIAVHEGGHALVAYHLPEADTVNRVTILPRGQSLGVTQFTAEVDRYNYRRSALMARIAVGLGGRVAEEITFGLDQITTGAENDLQVVTDLARRMVTRWGMSEHVGVVFADYQPGSDYALTMQRLDPEMLPARSLVADTKGNLFLNGMQEISTPQSFAMSAPAPRNTTNGIVMNVLIDSEVQRILNEGRAIAHTILNKHRDQLTLLADTLILHEQLDRGQFEALLQE